MKSKTNRFECFRIFYIRTLLAFFFTFSLGFGNTAKAYNVGDYGYIGSAAWSVAANWYIWNGASWVTAGGLLPTSLTDVYILTGDSVIVDAVSKDCKSLFVETGAKLLADPAVGSNFYITIYGKQIVNNGIIGSATAGIFNGISFQFWNDTTVISSDSLNPVIPANTPLFTCSRIRKDTNGPTTTTNLYISMNIYVTFFSNSQVQVYNDKSSSLFNITINQNATVNIGYLGSLRINGVSDASGGTKGGTLTVKGRLDVAGTMVLHTISANASYPCNTIIDSTGIISAQTLDCTASGLGKHTLTIRSGGKLEITGGGSTWNMPAGLVYFGGLNNVYNILYNSTIAFIGNAQTFPNTISYSNLILGTNGAKTLTFSPLTVTKNFTISGNATFLPATKVINIGGNYTATNEASMTSGTSTFNFTGVGATQQTITTGNTETFYNLNFTSSVDAKFNVPVTVANVISLGSCALDLNANQLTINTALTTALTRTTGYIISENVLNLGKIRWRLGMMAGTYVYPFGTTGGSYIPFTFKLNSGNADTVTVSTYSTNGFNLPWPVQPVAVTNLIGTNVLAVPDNRNYTVKRFWQVDTVGNANADITLSFSPVETPLAGGPYGAQRWSAPFWAAPFSSTTVGNSVTATGVTAFGALALASNLSPLPIELLRFTAEKMEDFVIAKWSTASEDNNDFFTVERLDGKNNIVSLGKVDGAGNSSELRHYSFTDKNPLYGTSYYRLRQTDYNGKTTESKWVAVNFTALQPSLMIFPNPSGGEEVYVLNAEESDKDLTYKILDLGGREVDSGPLNSLTSIPVKKLSRGVYFFIFSSLNKEPVAIRFVKE